MLGDVLKRRIHSLTNTTDRRTGSNAFWIVLRDIARDEIIEHKYPVDSDIIIPIYYNILCENLMYVPDHFKETLPSNGQRRFWVTIRNIFSSNSFHRAGLANQPGIVAYKEINEHKKGERVVYQKA